MRGERFMRGRDDLGMIGEAEIIVGTEVDDRVRLAAVVQGRARFGWAEQLRFVELDRPFADLVPSA